MKPRFKLVNREYQVKNASEARQVFYGYKSIENFDYWDTTSSAGDWTGWIVQRLSRRWYLIPFWQENNYPRYGFTLNTGEIIAAFSSRPDVETIYSILQEVVNQ